MLEKNKKDVSKTQNSLKIIVIYNEMKYNQINQLEFAGLKAIN